MDESIYRETLIAGIETAAAEAGIETEVVLGPHDEYPWANNTDEMLRTFLFQTLSDASHIPAEAIRQMQEYFEWIKTGVVPDAKTKRKSHLKTVDP